MSGLRAHPMAAAYKGDPRPTTGALAPGAAGPGHIAGVEYRRHAPHA